MGMCPVCLDVCQECVSCEQCNNILCRSHLDSLDRTCPVCRQRPCNFRRNVAAERLIQGLTQRLGIIVPPLCPASSRLPQDMQPDVAQPDQPDVSESNLEASRLVPLPTRQGYPSSEITPVLEYF